LGEYSFDLTLASLPSSLPAVCFGRLHNANTLEAFKRFDAAAMLEQERQRMWKDLQAHSAAVEAGGAAAGAAASSVTRVLSRFLLLSFADLKAHRYAYWFVSDEH